jgi:hypothetical protein
MTITFVNINDVIVYAFEKIISYARRTQQIFVAHCVWWLVSIIRLEQGLVNHIDNLHGRTVISKERQSKEVESTAVRNASIARDSATQQSEKDHQDTILKECEEFLKESRWLRDIAALKSKGKTQSARINPTQITKKALRKKRTKPAKDSLKPARDDLKTEGISNTEIQRRKELGECLGCALPSDMKGAHRVKSCIQPIKLDYGTANLPQSKTYQRIEISDIESSASE